MQNGSTEKAIHFYFTTSIFCWKHQYAKGSTPKIKKTDKMKEKVTNETYYCVVFVVIIIFHHQKHPLRAPANIIGLHAHHHTFLIVIFFLFHSLTPFASMNLFRGMCTSSLDVNVFSAPYIVLAFVAHSYKCEHTLGHIYLWNPSESEERSLLAMGSGVQQQHEKCQLKVNFVS